MYEYEDPFRAKTANFNGENDYSFLEFKSVNELDSQSPKEIWDKVICVGDRVMIAGATKSYKSFFAKQFSYCISYKLPFLSRRIVTPIPMLDLDMELREFFLRQRIKAIAEHLNGSNTELYRCLCLRGQAKKLTPDAIEELGRRLKKAQIGGICLDPIYKLQRNGLGDNSASEVNTLLDPFDDISFAHNLLFIWIHHHSKGNQALKESHERASGSGGYGRYADVIIDLIRHKHDFCFIVQITQRNFPAIKKFVVQFDLDSLLFNCRSDLNPEDVAEQPTPAKTRHILEKQLQTALAVVRALDDYGGVSRSQWFDLALMPESSFKKVKTMLINDKKVYESKTDDHFYLTPNYKSSFNSKQS
jgi:hypothetical protein